jgi:hypothetical protein
MIRKAVIVVLTLGAAGIAVGWVLSYSKWPGNWRFHCAALNLNGGHIPWTETYQEWWILHKANNKQLQQIGLVNGVLSAMASYETPRNKAPSERSYDWFAGSLRVETSWFGFTNRLVDIWLRVRLDVVFFVFAAYPVLAFIRGPLRRWRRHRKGLCLNCGYDLRGLTEPRCPECGKAFDPKLLEAQTIHDTTESRVHGE